jgi:hypothetical protein
MRSAQLGEIEKYASASYAIFSPCFLGQELAAGRFVFSLFVCRFDWGMRAA